VAAGLLEVARDTDEVLSWITRPLWTQRLVIGCAIALLLGLLVAGIWALDLGSEDFDSTELVPLAEAATNELLLIGAAVIYLVSSENRTKRRRVMHAVNQLRAIAHVIDAHQLTKDPQGPRHEGERTEHSPRRELSAYEIGRYLDYCSELLSMTAKLGFLYVQRFDDPVATNAVKELEDLTSGLSRKIWQKLMILESRVRVPGA
jgi:hypothetical protein